ncbi:hypothetical protein Pfo_023635 [Paulownia fortunei]|nr:hypothetical protein Pfo_023635 [Paulownia fortunei]
MSFTFKMIKTKAIHGVHRLESEANKYTKEERILMKTQDIGYILQKLQTEKKKIEKLNGMLYSLDNQSSGKHVYYAEDRQVIDSLIVLLAEEAREIQEKVLERGKIPAFEDLPKDIKRKMASSYRELEARRGRVKELKKIYEAQLQEDEIVSSTSRPVYK